MDNEIRKRASNLTDDVQNITITSRARASANSNLQKCILTPTSGLTIDDWSEEFLRNTFSRLRTRLIFHSRELASYTPVHDRRSEKMNRWSNM